MLETLKIEIEHKKQRFERLYYRGVILKLTVMDSTMAISRDLELTTIVSLYHFSGDIKVW